MLHKIGRYNLHLMKRFATNPHKDNKDNTFIQCSQNPKTFSVPQIFNITE